MNASGSGSFPEISVRSESCSSIPNRQSVHDRAERTPKSGTRNRSPSLRSAFATASLARCWSHSAISFRPTRFRSRSFTESFQRALAKLARADQFQSGSSSLCGRFSSTASKICSFVFMFPSSFWQSFHSIEHVADWKKSRH